MFFGRVIFFQYFYDRLKSFILTLHYSKNKAKAYQKICHYTRTYHHTQRKEVFNGDLVFREQSFLQCQWHSSRNRTYVGTRALSRRIQAIYSSREGVVTGGYRFGEWCTVRTCGEIPLGMGYHPPAVTLVTAAPGGFRGYSAHHELSRLGSFV